MIYVKDLGTFLTLFLFTLLFLGMLTLVVLEVIMKRIFKGIKKLILKVWDFKNRKCDDEDKSIQKEGDETVC